MNDCTLVIMAKAPKAGRVKTRLAACLPQAAITGLYRCLLADTLTLAQSLEAIDVALMSPAGDVEELSQVSGGLPVIGQSGEGLGAALTSVFAHFAASGPRRIVAFNSDSPHLPASALRTAFEVLHSYDVVIGPTHDGGYHLVGAKASHPGLFAASTLGTTSALESLLSRARSLALSVGFTETSYDVDLPTDLSQLSEELRARPTRAPRTAQWLAAWAQTTPKEHTSEPDL
jgi:hypothetical protein